MAKHKLIGLHEEDAYHPADPMSVQARAYGRPQPNIGELFYFTDEPTVSRIDGFIGVAVKRISDGQNFIFAFAEFEAVS